MPDTLHCPFCGVELNDYPDKTTDARMAVCRNPKCKYDGWHFPIDITQRMIDGKKAQDALNWLNEYLSEDKVEENVAVSCQYLKAKITSITKQENE